MTQQCATCGCENLTQVEGFSELPQVTSDCKPYPSGCQLVSCAACGAIQKVQDEKWQANCAAIYQAYDPNAQMQGLEPLVFSPEGVSAGRSVRVAERLFALADLPQEGKALDVGCGNGGILKVFSKRLPQWKLAGQEIDDKYRIILQIPGVVDFFNCSLEEIPGTFDVISMIHVLEHIPDPRTMLRTLREKLTPGGSLVIAIPCYVHNPFDLVIADHSLHFSPATLNSLLRQCGFEPVVTDVDWIPKEIVCIAKRAAGLAVPGAKSQLPNDLQMATERVAWLRRVLNEARELSHDQRVALFGSSIAASWVYGAMPERISHFVDEDPRRAGADWLDRKIVAPTQSSDCPILVPLAPVQAANVAQRFQREYPGLRVVPLGK